MMNVARGVAMDMTEFGVDERGMRQSRAFIVHFTSYTTFVTTRQRAMINRQRHTHRDDKEREREREREFAFAEWTVRAA